MTTLAVSNALVSLAGAS